jgi:GntR family transcriptional regulator, transcriptional repressor for pyruvate dehydrogenase complex
MGREVDDTWGEQVLMAQPTRRRSLTQEIVEQLLDLIGGHTTPELRLPPERVLADQLGVSRASLREALSALAHSGIVRTRGKAKYANPGRARARMLTSLASPSSERELVTDPLEVRRLLEPEVASKAAERATDRALGEIEQWLRLMEEGMRRGERVVEYDSAFHVSIARATENHTLTRLIEGLADSLRESRELSFWPREAADLSLAGHREILGALRMRDPEGARRAMREHLDHVEALLRETLSQGGRTVGSDDRYTEKPST